MRDKGSATWLFFAVGVVVVIVATFLLWFHSANTLPAVKIPTPVMPSPNAYDFYVAAAGAMRDKNTIGYTIMEMKPPPPGAKPAAQAGPDRWYSLAEKEALLAKNARALATLRQGFAYEYRNPPSRSFNTLYPYFADFRTMSRLLVLEGQARAGRGDWGRAIGSYLDAIRLGEDMVRGGAMIHMLVGVACQAYGRKGVWETLDHLDAAEARAAAHAMEEMIARHVPYAQVLEEEKWCGIASLVEMFTKGGWQSQLTGGGPGREFDPRELLVKVRMSMYNKRKIVKNYIRHMDQLIANARMPYAAKPPAPKVPTDPLNSLLAPVFGRARFSALSRDEAPNALLLVALALRAYRLEKEHYPASLAELVPAYLTKLPDDPFALKGPPRYRRIGDKYILYSIGPDGRDDGGKPIDNPSARAEERYRVEEHSKGDIVAGVNTN